jgi:hypothetical protein
VTMEVVQSEAGLNRGVLEKALEDRWDCDPGTCFCTRPVKHPDPAIVPEGSVVSKLQTNETVTVDTTVRGPAGVLAKLKGYFVNNYQLINHPDFTVGEQAWGGVVQNIVGGGKGQCDGRGGG